MIDFNNIEKNQENQPLSFAELEEKIKQILYEKLNLSLDTVEFGTAEFIRPKQNSSVFYKVFNNGNGFVLFAGDFATGEQFSECLNSNGKYRTMTEADQKIIQEAKEQRKKEREKQAEEDAKRAVQVLKNSNNVIPDDFGYCLKKGLKGSDFQAFQFTGFNSKYKNIVIPLFDIDGQHWANQFIYPEEITLKNGEKTDKITKGKMTSCFNVAGDFVNSDTVYLAEGATTALTVYIATGKPCVFCVNAGNIEPVFLALKEKYPDKKIILIADNDIKKEAEKGINKGHETAEKLNNKYGLPYILSPVDSDFNDFYKSFLDADETVEQALKKVADFVTGDSFQGFNKFALSAEELEKKIKEQIFILGKLAAKGEITVFFAPPNVGKTLILIHLLLQSSNITPEKTFFINADDSFQGVAQKTAILGKNKIICLADGLNGFKSKDLLSIIDDYVKFKACHDVILVIDTIKKFANTMDKSLMSEFINKIRDFCINGGTLVATAHTNKNRGADGALIPGGTSDLLDDCDAAYVVEKIDAEGLSKPGGKEFQIKFTQRKGRGGNAEEAFFTYIKPDNGDYKTLLKSVRELKDDIFQQIEKKTKLKRQFEQDRENIEAMRQLISEKALTKGELLKRTVNELGLSRRQAQRLISNYTGPDFEKYGFWIYEKAEKHNTKIYSNTEPSSKNSYQVFFGTIEDQEPEPEQKVFFIDFNNAPLQEDILKDQEILIIT